ncbi:MAG: hypothetical protein KGZ85_01360 [Ignavibacterium sp.]|nr:hypothetical protein [Ignavibacterium sp.]
MNILLDILGSSIIGGMILLMVLKLNIFASNANYYSDNELKLQQNVKTLAEILNYDLRKIGYKRDTTSMITAQPQRIKFFAELDAPGTGGYGTIDMVEYFLGDSTESTGTTNLRDKILYRVVNNTDTTGGSSLGLVDLKFSYMNAQGNTTANLDSIRYIKAEFWVEPQDALTNYVTGQADTTVFTYWELTIYPRNI